MKKRLYLLCKMLMITLLAGMFTFSAFPVQADNEETPIYGSQMMTQQERIEFRNRMQTAETNVDREIIRTEHHERMLERAKERGVSMPDDMPERGMGKGMRPGGMGSGRGMGSGGGMGGGSGR